MMTNNYRRFDVGATEPAHNDDYDDANDDNDDP